MIKTLYILLTILLCGLGFITFNLGMDYITFGYGMHPVIAFPMSMLAFFLAVASWVSRNSKIS